MLGKSNSKRGAPEQLGLANKPTMGRSAQFRWSNMKKSARLGHTVPGEEKEELQRTVVTLVGEVLLARIVALVHHECLILHSGALTGRVFVKPAREEAAMERRCQ